MFNSEFIERGDGKGDFLEEDDTEDDSEDCYSNLNSRGSST